MLYSAVFCCGVVWSFQGHGPSVSAEDRPSLIEVSTGAAPAGPFTLSQLTELVGAGAVVGSSARAAVLKMIAPT
jgi:hypothetical protein